MKNIQNVMLLLLSLFTISTYAQTTLTGGEFNYTETSTLINKLGKEIKKTNKHNIKLSSSFLKHSNQLSNAIAVTALFDFSNQTAGTYFTTSEKFYRTEDSFEPYFFDLGMYNLFTPSIKLVEETQIINGYTCKKAILTFLINNNTETIEAWFTTDIIFQPSKAKYIFKDLKGLPVKFTFRNLPRLSFGSPNTNNIIEFILEDYKQETNIQNNGITDVEKYSLLDTSRPEDMQLLMSAVLGGSNQKKQADKGTAITEVVTAADGSTISKTKYNPFTIGNKLAPFSGTDINGKTVSADTYKGKILVLNFWFTGCIPCIKEMPYLNAVKEKYKEADIAFVSITYNNKKETEAFFSKNNLSFDKIVDAQHLIDKYAISTYPLTLIADKNNSIRFVKVGELEGELEKEINKVMN